MTESVVRNSTRNILKGLAYLHSTNNIHRLQQCSRYCIKIHVYRRICHLRVETFCSVVSVGIQQKGQQQVCYLIIPLFGMRTTTISRVLFRLLLESNLMRPPTAQGTSLDQKIISFFLIGTRSFAAKFEVDKLVDSQSTEAISGDVYLSHSCIHDEILHQRWRPGCKEYSVTPQIYKEYDSSRSQSRTRRTLLSVSSLPILPKNSMHPIRIYLNYDVVGHSTDRDCRHVGDIVKLGEPPAASVFGNPACDPHGEPPVFVDCWYNCTLEDIVGEDKKHRLRKALELTTDWLKRALSIEPVRGNLRLSGSSSCGQDGGVQLPHEYIEDCIAAANLVLLVTTRPTTGNTLAWAVASESDQWGCAIAGQVNVAPCHLTAQAETLLSATLVHEVIHVLGFDPHAFAHFRNERK